MYICTTLIAITRALHHVRLQIQEATTSRAPSLELHPLTPVIRGGFYSVSHTLVVETSCCICCNFLFLVPFSSWSSSLIQVNQFLQKWAKIFGTKKKLQKVVMTMPMILTPDLLQSKLFRDLACQLNITRNSTTCWCCLCFRSSYEVLFKQQVTSDDIFLGMTSKNQSTASCEDILVINYQPVLLLLILLLSFISSFLPHKTTSPSQNVIVYLN